MSEPDNLVLAHLRELRADIEARFEQQRTEMDARFDAVDARFDRIEQRLEIMHSNGEKALRQFIGHRAMVERTMASFQVDFARA
jgi:hypothetical protein